MTSRGKRKPRYGFDEIVMPRRLPRTGTRRQADNALLMAARGTHRPQPTVPRELRYARSYPKPDPSEIRPRLVRRGSGNRSIKFTRETSMRSRGAPGGARRGGGTVGYCAGMRTESSVTAAGLSRARLISSIDRPLVSKPSSRNIAAACAYQKARNNKAGNSAEGTTLGLT